MGRLKLFNRSVHLAPDDVYVPGIYGLISHSIWLILTSIAYAALRNECNVSSVLLDYLLILIFALSASVILDAIIINLSMSGTVAREGLRQYVGRVVQISFLLRVWELGMSSYGIYVTYGPENYLQPVDTPDCKRTPDLNIPTIIQIVVVWSFTAMIFYFLTMGVLLANSDHKSGGKVDRHAKLWQSRLNFALGTGGLVESTILQDLSSDLAEFFKDFDWAPSDVALAEAHGEDEGRRTIFMNGRKPTFMDPKPKTPSKKASNPQAKIPSPNTPLKPFQFRKQRQLGHHRRPQPFNNGTIHREDIDDILHFARYAKIVYTPDEVNQVYSDRLRFHSSANNLYQAPYLIIHDAETDSLVIAIRGTQTPTDILVDLELEGKGDGEEVHYAHVGFMKTARNVVDDIRELGILGPLLNQPGSKFYGCGLVVTGHSLGAGVAALVAHFLRSEFPSTCCYAYEAPGCVVSGKAAKYFEQFCTSVVMGDDVVARLSRNTIELLKFDIIRQLENCHEPKWKVLSSVMGIRLGCGSKKVGSDKDNLLIRTTTVGRLDSVTLDTLKRKAVSFRAGMGTEENPFAELELPAPPMYIPGKILHIEKLRRPPLKLNQKFTQQIQRLKTAARMDSGSRHDSDISRKAIDCRVATVESAIIEEESDVIDDEKESLPNRTDTIQTQFNPTENEFVHDKQAPTVMDTKLNVLDGSNQYRKYHYVPRWARKEEFQEIIISRSMFSDHSPFEVLEEFQNAPAGSVIGVVTRD
ncbi:alpha/beta-hydrolase [Rhizoclosmatium globosum]|uniref:sn-1-specific diacylglycerol lipase n=1 Tax=Rhizoclosmatium globosum TaxID=329046 RepID=A0A1Y2C4K9_9FUNG|nr:alpha/beta-hydrolase [Rhizoclosmatium globosum]|eukprot:ORY41963.1 alpha/beta-hydrolase [Rhizoclosmatium globosum]